MRYRFLVLIAAALFGSAQTATAGYEFRFADTTGAYQSSFTIASVGSTVDIQVYLVATAGSPLADLRSYGVQVNYNEAIAKVNNAANITSNPAFTQAEIKSTGVNFARSADSTLSGGPYVNSSVDGSGNPRILLATFKFTGISAGTTSNVTTDPFPGFDNTVTGTTNTPLDALIANANATIAVVPEPGSLALCGLAAAGFAAGALRRIRKNKPVPTAAV